MKSLFVGSKQKCLLGMMLVILWGVFVPSLLAQSPTIDQAKRAKIDMTIRIAEEQVKRGLYQQAQLQLQKLSTPEFSEFISGS